VAAIIAGNDDTAFELEDGRSRPRFPWSAVVAGAIAALAVTGLLLLIGAGIGLTLITRQPEPGTASLATLGVIYYLFSFVFGFSVGGHLAGRTMGPHIASADDESLRAGAHGLVLWSLAALVWISVFALFRGGPADLILRLDPSGGARYSGDPTPVPPTSYWEDLLFRPQVESGQHASLAGLQFAQADTGQSTDATTAPPAPDTVQPAQPTPDQGATESQPYPSSPATQNETPQPPRQVIRHVPGDLAPTTLPPTPPTPANLAGDKSEVGRILEADLSSGGYLPVDDRDRVAQLVAQDANLSYEMATTRVNEVQGRIHNLYASLASGRTGERYNSLSLGFALLFGAAASVLTAVAARRSDDLQSVFAFFRVRI
jgi:hypothetical protein